jgi:hypothetical protein
MTNSASTDNYHELGVSLSSSPAEICAEVVVLRNERLVDEQPNPEEHARTGPLLVNVPDRFDSAQRAGLPREGQAGEQAPRPRLRRVDDPPVSTTGNRVQLAGLAQEGARGCALAQAVGPSPLRRPPPSSALDLPRSAQATRHAKTATSLPRASELPLSTSGSSIRVDSWVQPTLDQGEPTELAGHLRRC